MYQNEIRVINGYSDKSFLFALWQEAFDDSNEYLSFLYEIEYFTDSSVYALTCGNDLVCALAIVDIMCNINGKEKKAKYICNAATFKKYQGKGFMALLVNHILKENSAEIFTLIPADETLFKYYSRFGFKSNLKVNRKEFLPDNNINIKINKLSADYKEIEKVYNIYINKYSKVNLSFYKSFDLFIKTIKETEFDNIKDGLYYCNDSYGFVTFKNDKIILREPFGLNTEELAQKTASFFNKVVILEEINTFSESELSNVGMTYTADLILDDDEIGYINLLLN